MLRSLAAFTPPFFGSFGEGGRLLTDHEPLQEGILFAGHPEVCSQIS